MPAANWAYHWREMSWAPLCNVRTAVAQFLCRHHVQEKRSIVRYAGSHSLYLRQCLKLWSVQSHHPILDLPNDQDSG